MNELWNDLMKERFLKIGAMKAGGRNPWPNDQAPGWTNARARAAAKGRDPEELAATPIRVDVAGRVMGLRRFGKAAFLVLSDRTGRLQAYLKKDHLGEEAYDLFLKSVDAGDIVWVEGPLFLTRTGELTVAAARFRLLAKAIRPLPEKWHGLSDVETRYRQRYVDLIVNEDRSAWLICTDGNDGRILHEKISFTDFPLPEIRLFLTDRVLLLPSEY